jgi:hypothetical protein
VLIAADSWRPPTRVFQNTFGKSGQRVDEVTRGERVVARHLAVLPRFEQRGEYVAA